ncbi:universal stress protein [Methanopyrus sp.]
MFDRIMVPTDGSENAKQAAKVAIEIAKKEDATLIVIHVIPLWSPLGTKPSFTLPEEIVKEAEKIVNEIAEMAKEEGIDNVETLVVESPSVVQGIVEEAKERDVDLIVMGTRGLSGVKGLILGSTTKGVLSRSPCPVLAVPLEGEGEHEEG